MAEDCDIHLENLYLNNSNIKTVRRKKISKKIRKNLHEVRNEQFLDQKLQKNKKYSLLRTRINFVHHILIGDVTVISQNNQHGGKS